MAEDQKTHGRSKAGVELTDEVLERMAREAEAGLDVTSLRRRPGRPAMGSGPAETLPVRLEPELRKQSRTGQRPTTPQPPTLYAQRFAATWKSAERLV